MDAEVGQRFRDLVFHAGCRRAVRDDGTEISFTRTESAVLRHLAANPGRVLTRAQLLDAISGPGSDKIDRNIDFVVNRLRRKLGDSARDPHFIATRYGEGYEWIAATGPDAGPTAGAHIVLGPVFGVPAAGPGGRIAELFTEELRRGLEERLDRPVGLAPDGPEARDFASGEGPAFAVQLTFLQDGGRLDCVLTGREFPGGVRLGAVRETICAGPGAATTPAEEARRVAESVIQSIWCGRVLESTPEEPLSVSAHTSVMALTGQLNNWRELERRVDRLRAADPADVVAGLMRAAALHAGIVKRGPVGFVGGESRRAAALKEIRGLVAQALPEVQDRPEFAATAAKLMHFAEPERIDEALAMAEAAHAASTSPAATLTVTGHLRALAGHFDAGLAALNAARELARPASQFEVYILVLLLQVVRAAGRDEDLAPLLTRLYEVQPDARHLFAISVEGRAPDSLAGRGVLRASPRFASRALLRYIHFISARLFRDPAHGDNVMRPAVTCLTRLHGDRILPAELDHWRQRQAG